MAELRYNISQLFQQGFFTSFQRFPLANVDRNNPPAELDYSGIEVLEVNTEGLPVSLGNPVMFPISLGGANYNFWDEGEIVQRNVDVINLPYTAICEFKQGSTKKKTRISGGQGSVKEWYDMDDWTLRIMGAILPNSNLGTTTEQLKKIAELKKIADSIDVGGELFRILGIYKISIDDVSFFQIKGFPDVIGFQINAESDEPVELIL